MSIHKIEYPTPLTNKAWQSKKGLLSAWSTGVGETLETLERVFKASPYGQGVDLADLVAVDPVETYDAVHKLRTRLDPHSRTVGQAIVSARKKLVEVERSTRGKSPLKKAHDHIETMLKALDALEEEQKGFFGVVAELAVEEFYEVERLSRSTERLNELGEEAQRLLNQFDPMRQEADNARTPTELRNAMTLRTVHIDILQMGQLWSLATEDYKTLLMNLGSPLAAPGSALQMYEQLKLMYRLASNNNDMMTRHLIADLMQENPGPNNTEAEAVQNIARIYLKDLDEAEVLVGEVAAVYEGLERARRKLAELRNQRD